MTVFRPGTIVPPTGAHEYMGIAHIATVQGGKIVPTYSPAQGATYLGDLPANLYIVTDPWATGVISWKASNPAHIPSIVRASGARLFHFQGSFKMTYDARQRAPVATFPPGTDIPGVYFSYPNGTPKRAKISAKAKFGLKWQSDISTSMQGNGKFRLVYSHKMDRGVAMVDAKIDKAASQSGEDEKSFTWQEVAWDADRAGGMDIGVRLVWVPNGTFAADETGLTGGGVTAGVSTYND